MKRLILLFLLFPHVLTAQWCLNFEDMQLEASFQGRDSAWEITPVEAISGQYSLHHCLDDTISNHDVIAWLFDSLVIEDMATSWLQLAGTHHQVLHLGYIKNRWKMFCQLLGIEYAEV